MSRVETIIWNEALVSLLMVAHKEPLYQFLNDYEAIHFVNDPLSDEKTDGLYDALFLIVRLLARQQGLPTDGITFHMVVDVAMDSLGESYPDGIWPRHEGK